MAPHATKRTRSSDSAETMSADRRPEIHLQSCKSSEHGVFNARDTSALRPGSVPRSILLQPRVMLEYGPERLAAVIEELRVQDGRFHMEGGSWTNGGARPRLSPTTSDRRSLRGRRRRRRGGRGSTRTDIFPRAPMTSRGGAPAELIKSNRASETSVAEFA